MVYALKLAKSCGLSDNHMGISNHQSAKGMPCAEVCTRLGYAQEICILLDILGGWPPAPVQNRVA